VAMTLSLGQRMMEKFIEQLPVRQAGQGVVIGQLPDILALLLELLLQPYAFEAGFDCVRELVQRNRFQHVVTDADVDGVDYVGRVAGCREDDHPGSPVKRLDLSGHADAVHFRHQYVGDNDVGMTVYEEFQSLAAIFRIDDGKLGELLAKHEGNHVPRGLIILNVEESDSFFFLRGKEHGYPFWVAVHHDGRCR
jgi:hypothetical protein